MKTSRGNFILSIRYINLILLPDLLKKLQYISLFLEPWLWFEVVVPCFQCICAIQSVFYPNIALYKCILQYYFNRNYNPLHAMPPPHSPCAAEHTGGAALWRHGCATATDALDGVLIKSILMNFILCWAKHGAMLVPHFAHRNITCSKNNKLNNKYNKNLDN